jgi:DNA-binding response OmpR family regulator
MTTESPVLTPPMHSATLAPRPMESPTLAPQPAEPPHLTPQPMEPAAAQSDRAGGRTIVFGNLELRLDEMQALVEGTRVGLTVREFQVLAVLADRADRVVRRPEIYRNVWGGEMKHRDRAVDVFVRKVRTKLAATAPGWAYVHTHFGIGYRFAPEPAMSAQDEERTEGAAA